jgi:ribonucleoside-diphosphate reductase alpha chain
MTGHAYATSARTASRMGPFAGFAENEQHMLNVLRMHRDAHIEIASHINVPAELVTAGQQAWESAVRDGEEYGVRNAQASVLAPTGTIGLMMDCDTTGIEPDLGLVKMKKLVGGGNMTIVNQTIPRALRKLGYTPEQIEDIVAYIDTEKSILGAPHLAAEHVAVFACSMGDNTIHYEGHVRMMGAVQPFISGAISKTVNMPEEASVEDVEALHLLSWQLGLKAVAIYRDNCKVGQPLSTAKKDGAAEPEPAAAEATQVIERIVEKIVHQPVRQKLPRSRRGRDHNACAARAAPSARGQGARRSRRPRARLRTSWRRRLERARRRTPPRAERRAPAVAAIRTSPPRSRGSSRASRRA